MAHLRKLQAMKGAYIHVIGNMQQYCFTIEIHEDLLHDTNMSENGSHKARGKNKYQKKHFVD